MSANAIPTAPTLSDVFAAYLASRKLSSETVRNYKQRLRNLEDWKKLPVGEITRGMIVQRHQEITGAATANGTMRTLRALLHFANVSYEDELGFPIIRSNPVRQVLWNESQSAARALTNEELKAFYKAVWTLDNTTARDLLLLILFVGITGKQAMSLRWDSVNLDFASVTVDSIHLPVSDFILKLLTVRSFGASSEFVFPGRCGSHAKWCAKSFQTVKRRSGVSFTLYDVRATFQAIATSLHIDDPLKPNATRSMARLRRSSERITADILRRVGIETVSQLGGLL